MVFVTHGPGTLKAFRIDCGQGGATCRPEWVWNPLFATEASSVSVSSGVAYVTADRLYAISLSCGEHGATCRPLWSAPINGELGPASPLAAPYASGGLVFAAGERLFAFPQSCATTQQAVCQAVWQSGLLSQQAGPSRVVASDNAVYVVTADGRLYAFTIGGRAA
jgi:outer membrane protein assembly factor BamB